MTTTEPDHSVFSEPAETQARYGRWAVTESDSDETLVALYVIDPANTSERYPYVLLTPDQVRDLINDLARELAGMATNWFDRHQLSERTKHQP
jgi:hypothetical protein